jgi:hypothetical protein
MMPPEDDPLAEGLTSAWFAPCQECHTSLPPLRDVADRFFEVGEVPCQECGARIDVWKAALAIVGDAIGPVPVSYLGASSTLFSFRLRCHEFRTIDFATYGVPAEAIVLGVNYTPQGIGRFPVEVKGNAARSRLLGTSGTVYGPAPSPGNA